MSGGVFTANVIVNKYAQAFMIITQQRISTSIALILVITGFYLWWPRGQKGGVMSVRTHWRRRSSRCVAKECRSAWGPTGAAPSADR